MKNASIWLSVKGANLLARARDLGNDRKGVTAMEYGVIAAVTVVTVGGLMGAISTGLTTVFTAAATAL